MHPGNQSNHVGQCVHLQPNEHLTKDIHPEHLTALTEQDSNGDTLAFDRKPPEYASG